MGVKRWWVLGGGMLLLTAGVFLFWQVKLALTPTLPVRSVSTIESTNSNQTTAADESEQSVVIAQWYAPLYPMMIGSVSVLASVASTSETRTKGLSGTPYLPEGIAKLFIFEESGTWSFWMKDMNYAIDMVWVNESREVIHIESAVTPNSFPKTFAPSVPARYVLELPNGFTYEHGIKIGDMVTLPTFASEGDAE